MTTVKLTILGAEVLGEPLSASESSTDRLPGGRLSSQQSRRVSVPIDRAVQFRNRVPACPLCPAGDDTVTESRRRVGEVIRPPPAVRSERSPVSSGREEGQLWSGRRREVKVRPPQKFRLRAAWAQPTVHGRCCRVSDGAGPADCYHEARTSLHYQSYT